MQQNVTISQAIQLATQYLQNKQFQQSWSICQKILQHEPQNQQVHWILNNIKNIKSADLYPKELEDNFKKMVSKYCKYISAQGFNYSINISNKYNYMFVETPKVACSTIKVTLQRMELETTELFNKRNIHKREFSPLIKPSQVGNFDKFLNRKKLFKFCFVRNPYTRLLSAYLEKIKLGKNQKRSILLHMGKYPYNLNTEISFSEFVHVVCEQSIISMDNHWRIQYYQTFQDHINYDFCGKLENFDQDIKTVLSKINKNYSKYMLSRRTHSTEANNLLEQYYCSELIKKVQEKYAKDFEYFNYSFEFRDAF